MTTRSARDTLLQPIRFKGISVNHSSGSAKPNWVICLSFLLLTTGMTSPSSAVAQSAECDLESKNTGHTAYQKRPKKNSRYCEGIVYENNSLGLHEVALVGYRAASFFYALNTSKTHLYFPGTTDKAVHSIIKSKPGLVNYRRDEHITTFVDAIPWKLNIIKNAGIRLAPKDILCLACSPNCAKEDRVLVPTTIADTDPTSDLAVTLSIPENTRRILLWLADEDKRTDRGDPIVDEQPESIDWTGYQEFQISAFEGTKILDVMIMLNDPNASPIYYSTKIGGYDH